MHIPLAIADGNGDPTSAIASAGQTIDTLLLAFIGALTGMVVLLWVAMKLGGSVMHMLGGLPWFRQHSSLGDDLHKRANSAIFKLLLEAPLIIAAAVLIGKIVAGITGFQIPLTFPTLPGH